MREPLWQKHGVAIDAKIMAFLAAEDVILDRELFLFDVEASAAHAEGLARIGVLAEADRAAIERELVALAEDYREGRFVLDDRFEDGHSAIEHALVERLGDAGKRVHLGRSRNDQVLVALRLWQRARLADLASICEKIAAVCIDRAEREAIPMPGYTHLQRAVVSSTTMWWAGYGESFLDDRDRAVATRGWLDACPLGTAAGYGVNLPLDRDHVAARLGFSRLVVAPVAAQLARGKAEMASLEALGSALLDLRRLAWDLSLFTTSELGFVALPPEHTTGSSIMPNKRNPDVVELLRAAYATVSAARSEIEQTLSLPSGYQRDLQATKGPLIRGFSRGLAALDVALDLLARMEWAPDRMRAAIDPAMYATDRAVELAASGVPFRDAYKQAADEADGAGRGRSPEASLAARVSPGAHAAPRLSDLRSRLGL